MAQLPDNRLRFSPALISFDTHVGLSGQSHDDFPAPRTQARYDQLRLYLIALLANQSSYSEPVEYRQGSLWFDLTTNSLKINKNIGWSDISTAVELDTDLTLQQWYTAVRDVLTGSADSPDPFSKAVFTTHQYSDPAWLTGLSTGKLIGTIDASKVSGTFAPSLFPQLAIGSPIDQSIPGSVLFVNSSGAISQDNDECFKYNATLHAIQLNTVSNSPSLQINQSVYQNDTSFSMKFQQVTKMIMGVAGRSDAGVIGTEVGDVFLNSIAGSIVFSAGAGSAVSFKIDTNGVTTIENLTGNAQFVINSVNDNSASLIEFQRDGTYYSWFGLAGIDADNVLIGASANDFVFQNRSGSFLFSAGGDSPHFTISRAGVAVAGTITASGSFACDNIVADGHIYCGQIVNSSIATSGTIGCYSLVVNGGIIVGSGAGLTNIPQSGIVGLTDALALLATDAVSVHLTGTETIHGTKIIVPANSIGTPLVLKGINGQVANLLEVQDSTNAVIVSVSPTGVITGDGSGLSKLNLTTSSISGILGVDHGGTNSNGAFGARSSLGLAIGVDVQAHSDSLDSIAGFALAKGKLIIATNNEWIGLAGGSDNAYLVYDSSVQCGIRWSNNFSSPGAGGASEHFGAGSISDGNNSVAFGNTASATNINAVAVGAYSAAATDSIAIGYASIAAPYSVVLGNATVGASWAIGIGAGVSAGGTHCAAIGFGAIANNANDIVIGNAALGTTNGFGPALAIGANAIAYGMSIALGHGAETGNHTASIVIGADATATSAGQFVVGSSSSPITSVYFGAGVTSTTLAEVLISAAGGAGTGDNTGSNLVISGGVGTGIGACGSIIFKYAPITSPSTNPNRLVECGRFDTTGAFNAISGLFQPNASTTIPLTAKGIDGQSVDLQQWMNSSGTILGRFSKDGRLGIGVVPTNLLDLASSSLANLVGFAQTMATGTVYGINGSVSGASTTNYGSTLTVSGGTTSNYGVAVAVGGGGASNCYGFSSVVNAATSGNNIGANVVTSGGTINYGLKSAVNGTSASTNYGVYSAAINTNSGTNCGLYGLAYGAPNNYAGLFEGRLVVKVNASETNHHYIELHNASDALLSGIDKYGNPIGGLHLGGLAEGRLSLDHYDTFPSAASTTTSGSVLYYLPYVGDRITIHNITTGFPETLVIPAAANALSINLATYANAANTNYDVFLINNGDNTMALNLLAWSDSSAGGGIRNTSLARHASGMVTKSAAINYRYIGTIRTTGAGTCVDNITQGFVWNFHNRRKKKLELLMSTNSWTNSTNCYSPMNYNNVAIKHIEFIIGYQDGTIAEFRAYLAAQTANIATGSAMVAIGQNISLINAICGTWNNTTSDINGRIIGANSGAVISAHLIQYPIAAYHYFTAMENSVGVSTFYGGFNWTSGILGYIEG